MDHQKLSKNLKSERRLKVLISILALILAVLAFQFGGIVSQYFAHSRYPAAIDDSQRTAFEPNLLPQEQLIKNAEVVTTKKGLGLELGAFLLKNDQGNFVTTCEVFTKIVLTFHAGDMAVNGDAPKMIVEGPCEPGEDPQTIAILPINKRAINDIPTKEVELLYEDSGITIRFENVSDNWPGVWILQSVKLAGFKEKSLLVSQEDIRRIRGEPIILNW